MGARLLLLLACRLLFLARRLLFLVGGLRARRGVAFAGAVIVFRHRLLVFPIDRLRFGRRLNLGRLACFLRRGPRGILPARCREWLITILLRLRQIPGVRSGWLGNEPWRDALVHCGNRRAGEDWTVDDQRLTGSEGCTPRDG